MKFEARVTVKTIKFSHSNTALVLPNWIGANKVYNGAVTYMKFFLVGYTPALYHQLNCSEYFLQTKFNHTFADRVSKAADPFPF